MLQLNKYETAQNFTSSCIVLQIKTILWSHHARTGKNREIQLNQQTIPCQVLAQLNKIWSCLIFITPYFLFLGRNRSSGGKWARTINPKMQEKKSLKEVWQKTWKVFRHFCNIIDLGCSKYCEWSFGAKCLLTYKVSNIRCCRSV